VLFNAFRLPSAPSRRLASVEMRFTSLFGLCLLIGSCALASFGFACATPFAAFAVVAADMLPLPLALLVMIVVYANTLLWGFAIGAGALAATAEASVVLRSRTGSNQNTPAALGIAFVAAYSA
jgi:hypothetical protein